MWVWGRYYSTRTSIHTRLVLRIITHTRNMFPNPKYEFLLLPVVVFILYPLYMDQIVIPTQKEIIKLFQLSREPIFVFGN
jgi:hypothetical protein